MLIKYLLYYSFAVLWKKFNNNKSTEKCMTLLVLRQKDSNGINIWKMLVLDDDGKKGG